MAGRVRRFLQRTAARLTPSGSVAERTVMSGIWVTATNVIDRGLQVLMLIVLARLLTPRDFGLFGITLLVFSAMRKFTEIGVDVALIQQRSENVDDYLNTVWVIEIARGATVAAVLFAVAPLIASLFGEPRAIGLLRVMTLSPLVLGLRNPGVVYFQKNLEFHKQFVYQLSGSVVLFVLTVGYALAYRSVWSLVLGFVAADVTRMIVSYFTHDHRPRFEFDLSLAKELVEYGKWVTGSSILQFLYNEGDDVIVGWVLSATALGFYQLAYRLANAPATEVSQIISQVMFPTYSILQEDSRRLRESFYRTLRITTLVTFPAAFGIAAVTPSFVEAFLGEEWLPMVTAMQLLAIYGLIRALGKTYAPIWMAIGRPDYLTKLSLLSTVLIAVFIYPVTVAYGIEGTALVIVGTDLLVMLPLSVFLVIDSVNTTYFDFLREISYPFVASAMMWAVIMLIRESTSFRWAVAEFTVLVSAGALVYVTVVLALDTIFDWELVENIATIKNAL